MLDNRVRELASTGGFAALATLLPSGAPQVHVMWVDCDDDHVLINTERHRQKFHNVRRDPRVAAVLWDPRDPYVTAEVRGEVVDIVTGDAARAHVDELSWRYEGRAYDPSIIQSERVVLRIRQDHVTRHR